MRCFINPVTTIKYINGLCNLEHPRQIIARCPVLPAKIQRPYLYKGMRVSKRARTILEHYQFVQSFPDDYIRQILLPDRQVLLVHVGVSLDIENYCTLRLFFDLSILAGLSRRNLPEAGIRLLFQI
ncbi:DUF535 family protein [Salmonella enterica]|nr:DUF535 family protein [Salmonella enterica]